MIKYIVKLRKMAIKNNLKKLRECYFKQKKGITTRDDNSVVIANIAFLFVMLIVKNTTRKQ